MEIHVQEKTIVDIVEKIRTVFPHIPEVDAKEIYYKIKNNRNKFDRNAINSMAYAHARHKYTKYDKLLKFGRNRFSARNEVDGSILTIIKLWRFGDCSDTVEKETYNYKRRLK